MKDHLRPFLLIQACVIGFVFAYYTIPSVSKFADSLGALKAQGGLVFAFIATAFAGVILPEAFKIASNDEKRLYGIIVDVFYRLLGQILGNDYNVGTVAAKVAIDQFIAAPLIFMPYFVTLVLWRHLRFSFPALRAELKAQPLYKKIWPALVVNWAFWIPVLCGVYSMPQNLQFVLFLFVEAAWSLIIIHVTKSMNEAATA